MTYEPRLRGSRFRRPRPKKSSSKEKTEERRASIFYQEPEQVDISQVSSNTLNALEHLGNQRFTLPPFSEHFQRWMKDVRVLLTEFETQLPEPVKQQYLENISKFLPSVEDALTKRVEEEKNTSMELSKLLQQLSATELDLSKLDHEYKTRTGEIRRQLEKSSDKLRKEIAFLDKQRLKILSKRASFLQRVFGRSGSRLEQSSNALESKKKALGASKETLQEELEKYRADHESRRKQLVTVQESLRARLAELRENTLDDAMEVRKQACQELQEAIRKAVERLSGEQNSLNAVNAQ